MTDLLANMKRKFELLSIAYAFPNGLLLLDTYSGMLVDELAVAMNLTDKESMHSIFNSVENLITLRAVFAGRESAWCTVEEWAEAIGWHALKQPRINASKWRYWFTAMFQVLDADHDGYINKEQFGMFYLNTNRKNDQAFLDHAFSSIDTSKTGKLSKEQYVGAHTDYMTDPDITPDQFPLY